MGNILVGVFVFALIVLLLPVWLPFVLLWLTYRALLYMLIWLIWLPRGKNVLLVYSDSPQWRDYMIGEILPLVQGRAVVLNWSERKRWSGWSLAVRAFHSFGGDRDFNPMVIVFRPFQLAKTFRFWSAFKAWKHGKKERITKLRQELTLVL